MKPPAPGPERNLSYPEVPEKRLSNGLRILVVTDSTLPRVSVKLVIPAGRVCNPDGNLALISLAAELTKTGTERRSVREISDEMDQLAIRYASEVVMEHAHFSMTFLEDHLEAALDLLSDMVQNPSFPDEELEKVKIRWRSHLIAQRSQPGFLANEHTFRTIYTNHPYSKVSMTPEDLDRSTRESVRDTYRRHFVPGGAFLLLAGSVDWNRATQLAERYFATWENCDVSPVEYPEPVGIVKRSVHLVHRPHSTQSYILVASRTLPKGHPDSLHLRVANQVFGGSASARLFLNLREEKGYTYGAYSRLKSYRHDGLLQAGASVNTEVTQQAIDEILKEIRSMSERPPDSLELCRCQSELIGSFIRRMETPAAVGALETERRLYQLPEKFYRDFIPSIRAVTTSMVSDMTERFFDSQHQVITVVADRAHVEEKLGKFGELSVFDVNGNRV